MRKKEAMILAIVSISILLSIMCSNYIRENSKNTENTENKSDKTVENNDEIQNIPFSDITYNGENITLESIKIYQEESSSGFGYYPYVIITLDKTKLSDKNFYWLIENKDLDIKCYYESEKNRIDYDIMPLLKAYYNNEKIVYIFDEYTKEFKYDFSDINLTIKLSLVQEETYDYKNKYGTTEEQNIVNEYKCSVNKNYSKIQSQVMDISEMSQEEKEMLQIGLNETYELQKKIYSSMLN